MEKVIVTLPLHTISESNRRGHWSKHSKRIKEHRHVTAMALRPKLLEFFAPRELYLSPDLSVLVYLKRYAPSSGLDDDNLRGSLKSIRDGIADALGVDDRDHRIIWHYSQARGPYSVQIELTATPWR